ncbi:MAG: hypothetical protein LBH91_03130 [Prevotellaceae bacterium]|jgi:hypothetical protein|nr:hypothetical protein [Prevotellaceae bacterium]
MNAIRNYRKFYALLKQLPGAPEKEDVVMEFTNNRTEHLSAMTDVEWAVMIARLTGLVAIKGFDGNSYNIWRKRVIKSIGAWLELCRTSHNIGTIKAIACRAAKRQWFNDITISELRAIYHEFNNKQKIAKNTKNLQYYGSNTSNNDRRGASAV